MKKYLFLVFVILGFSYGETLDEVLSKALESGIVKGKQYEVKSFEGEIIKAKSFQNPEVYVELGRLISKGSSSLNLTELSVSQPLTLYGLRKYRINEAKSVLEAANYNYELFLNDYKAQVYRLFFESLYKKELLKITKQELEFSKSLYDFVKKTYELGEVTKIDLFRSEKEFNLTKTNYEKSVAEYRESLKRLSSIVGFEVSDVEGDFYSLKDLRNIDFSQHPEVRFYQKNIEALSYQENYYRALSKPQFSVGFITKEATKNNYESGVFISATIPAFYRYTGELVSIRNRKLQYENLTEYALKSLKLRYESILQTYEYLKQQLDKIDREVLSTLEKQLQLSEKSYKLKVITLFELTSIKNEYFQTLRFKLEIIDTIHKNYAEYIKIGGQVW
ncbi:TolC family protein [Sulfurihydrogenibium sp.]|uniref:TolC family protein n=1 Tax=Sulfurihydrogenibium sp. TaxID=2053621 RepID=UPI003D0E3BE3